MRSHKRTLMTMVLCGAVVFPGGCANLSSNQPVAPNSTKSQNAAQLYMKQNMDSRMALRTGGIVKIPLLMVNGIPYFSVNQLASTLQFSTKWDADSGRLLMGDRDAVYELNAGFDKARKAGKEVNLRHPPLIHDGVPYLPVSALSELFADELTYAEKDRQLEIYPSSSDMRGLQMSAGRGTSGSKTAGGQALAFQDDPLDPYRGKDYMNDAEDSGSAANPGNAGRLHLKQNNGAVNMNALITRARHYLGARYAFGAEGYPQSDAFDCSSFTQYIYGQYGVDLPRLARMQAEKGRDVDRKSLRKGDLLFFAVPGNYKSGKTVGHVGIYMGNHQMIHASPSPRNGVQITDINTPYWQASFLKAKRLVTS